MKQINENIIINELTDKWFENDEIKKIIQWTRDIINWNTFTAEEIYDIYLQ